jgi:hypothetical protein
MLYPQSAAAASPVPGFRARSLPSRDRANAETLCPRALGPGACQHRNVGNRRDRPCVWVASVGGFGWSCSGGHIGGEDVVGVPVQVVAGTVVSHGGAWVGVAGGDLDVA